MIIIPLGGIGSRFKQNDYKVPKALIPVLGYPILFWLLKNLRNTTELIYIPYNKEYTKFRIDSLIKKEFPQMNFRFFILEKNTDGAAETIKIALENFENEINMNEPILCLDGDNFYTIDIITLWKSENTVFFFTDNGDKAQYSYLKIDENYNILEIQEKEKISNKACTGAYGFSSSRSLLSYCNRIVDGNIRQKNEFYTSTVISKMLQDKIQFKAKEVNKSDYICLGTPFQIRLFCNNYPKINSLNNNLMIPSKRFCFDLDNTLVTFPLVPNDYSTVEPITENINFLKYLKSFGHTIIIYTARRMKTHKGNIGKINSDIGRITFDTLDKFDIPYDELYFGKPYAHYYIDDLAISCFHDLEKETGFYRSSVNSRCFNKIDNTSIELYHKTSINSLEGEIYWYNNIPLCIKDMFPIMFDFDSANFTSYKIEKIDGIPITKMYCNELLSVSQLEHIMNSIHRIHLSKIPTQEEKKKLNLYSNYSEKLMHRYNEYDYSSFINHKEVYETIKQDLFNYEKKEKAIWGTIHGDTVTSNILINSFGKIKFIDMRGQLGKVNTIFGDVMYDWAKLYQSLICYDEIMENIIISSSYKEKILHAFTKKILTLFPEEYLQYIKIITKSLLFSLLPLHIDSPRKQKLYFSKIMDI